MVLDARPASLDREILRETVDALRHSSRGIVLLVLASLRAGSGGGTKLHAAFGPEPSTVEYQEAFSGNLSQATERRRALLEQSLTRHQAAQRLGVSSQAVSGMLERGALTGLKEGREWRIPAWQFDQESPTAIVPGLRELTSRFPGSVVALSRWVQREHPDLDGMTPRAVLRQGGAEKVLRLVATL